MLGCHEINEHLFDISETEIELFSTKKSFIFKGTKNVKNTTENLQRYTYKAFNCVKYKQNPFSE